MELSISNLAWSYKNRHNMFSFLKKNDIKHIEIVFTKYNSWNNITNVEIQKIKKELDRYSLNALSAQSLLYGLNYTLNDDNKIINHIKKVIDYSQILGLKVLVFGSPSVRTKVDNYEIKLKKIFKQIDEYLNNKNIILCIEPNSKIYKGEYFFNLSEIVDFIENNNLHNIKTMIDTHNLIMENENPLLSIEKYINYIHHIHISEKNLEIISDLNFHNIFANKLKKILYSNIVTYEVSECKNIYNSIETFKRIYK